MVLQYISSSNIYLVPQNLSFNIPLFINCGCTLTLVFRRLISLIYISDKAHAMDTEIKKNKNQALHYINIKMALPTFF